MYLNLKAFSWGKYCILAQVLESRYFLKWEAFFERFDNFKFMVLFKVGSLL